MKQIKTILKLFLTALVLYWIIALFIEELKPRNKKPPIVIIEGGYYDKKGK